MNTIIKHHNLHVTFSTFHKMESIEECILMFKITSLLISFKKNPFIIWGILIIRLINGGSSLPTAERWFIFIRQQKEVWNFVIGFLWQVYINVYLDVNTGLRTIVSHTWCFSYLMNLGGRDALRQSLWFSESRFSSLPGSLS